MLVLCLWLFLKVPIVVAFTLPPQEIISTPSLSIKDAGFEKMCNQKSENDALRLTPWQEISQRAHGCSVPYHGPQGHGQYPEEVHIVHIMNVDRLVHSLSSQHQAMATITVWLDAGICENKTISLEQQDRPSKNDSEPLYDNENQSNVMKENMPSILKLKSSLPSHATDLFASHDVLDVPQSYSNQRTSQTPRPLVLLLTSDQPVIWQIKPGACWAQAMASSIQAMVERNSPVVSDLLVEVVPKIWVKKINRKSIQRYARRTFHGIASFTQIRGANSVRIIVGPTGPSSGENILPFPLRNRNKLNFCDFSSREESNLVSASLSVPISAESCFLGDENATKLFVIEVQPPSVSSLRGVLYDKVTPPVDNSGNRAVVNLPSVLVRLFENKSTFFVKSDQEADFPAQILSNVTLILRSQQRIHWSLFSFVQHTNINVVTAEGDTIECINNCGDTIKMSSQPLPQSRLDLINKVLSVYGPSMHYFFINKDATGFTFAIDNPSHQIQQEVKSHPSPSDVHLPPWSISQRSSYHPADLSSADQKKNTQTILESQMVIVCGKSSMEIVVPSPALMHLGVTALYLRDQSCQSTYNGTHFLLSSLFRSCGSSIHTDTRASVISNSVRAGFASQNDNGVSTGNLVSSLPNSNLAEANGIPVACGVKPTMDEGVLRSMFNSRDDITSEEDEALGNSSPNPGSSSIYQLELYHRDPATSDLIPINYKRVIDLDNRIYVRAWMDDAPAAQAVAESCWISNLPYSALWAPYQKIVLLSGICPLEKNVNLEQQPLFLTKSFLFSFQMLSDFLQLGQELYVHCQVGLCISSMKHLKGKPILCVDPQEYCLLHGRTSTQKNLVSTAHQLLTRGPLRIAPGNHSISPNLSSETKCAVSPAFPFSAVIGMDMTVAIALGSVTIGIGLTATLWFIHTKTEPIHRGCHARDHSLGSQSAVIVSSLSPHSAYSSTNSQSAIAS